MAKRKSSGGTVLLVIVLVVIMVAVVKPNNSPGLPASSSDPRQLAAQVLALPNDIVMKDALRVALDNYARTGELMNFCGVKLPEVDPLLLQNLLTLQHDGYRVLINNFGIGDDRSPSLCQGHDQHMLARAVDVNGVVKIGGPQTSWGGIRFRPGPEMEAIQSYADAWLALLPRNRGGVGQERCLDGRVQPGGFHVTIPPGSTDTFPESFSDSCDHLHLDVRIR